MPAEDQGSLRGRYTLIPRTLIFVTRGDRVLLLRGSPKKRLWSNRYNGLGGHIERGEDVLGAGRRELFEETGLDVPLWLCGVVTIDTDKQVGVGLYVLRGECPLGEPRPSDEGVAEWVAAVDLATLPLVEDLTCLLPRVLALQPGDAPFSAHYRYTDSGEMYIAFHEDRIT